MSLILPQKISEIDVPYIVACEGYGDVCLVAKLLEERNITNCKVGCPSRQGVGGDGKDYLHKYLDAVALVVANHQSQPLRGLIVIVDADHDQNAAFALACKALTFAEFPVPERAFTPEISGELRVGVYIVPGIGETGTLENLLLRSVYENAPEAEACVESFLQCVGKGPGDQPNVLANMRMSALVAASFPNNPWATPGPLILSSKNNLIPIGSPHFHPLADFLVEFCAE
jgi:hypothetical protein